MYRNEMYGQIGWEKRPRCRGIPNRINCRPLAEMSCHNPQASKEFITIR